MPISSAISDEMTITERPSAGERGDEPVDLLLGADVDAARRLVDDDDARIELHHLGEQAASAGCRPTSGRREGSCRRRGCRSAGSPRRAPAASLRAVDERPALELVERGERQVGRDRLLEQQAFALAVLGQIDGAGAHAGARVGPVLRRARRAGSRRRPCAGRTSASNSSVRPAPTRPEKPRISPGRTRSSRPRRSPARRNALTSNAGSPVGRGRARRIEREKVASDHQPRHVDRLEFGRRLGRHLLAVAQHRDDVGDGLHLLQTVGDVEDRDALRP